MQPAQLDGTRKVIVFALAGWSGFFVMAVELLSGRVLAPSFGNSIYVWGAVITVFMLALAVGYLLGGHFSVHSPSLRRLGALLIAAGLATLPVVLFGESALDWIFDRVTDPRYGSLNLAQAVQLIAYEWRQALGGFGVQPRTADAQAADDAAVQGALDHWQHALVALGYLDPQAPKKLMPRLRQMLNRARLTPQEVHILRGIARAVEKDRPARPRAASAGPDGVA